MIVLESLQMAQMVADLSELEAARNERARALLQANKEKEAEAAPAATAAAASAPATPASELPPSTTADHRGTSSAASVFSSPSANGTASPFDSYLGRFLTPALTRTNSFHGTGLNTPQGQNHNQNHNQNSTHTADVDRASSMVALNELRAKLKQYNDSASLRQARDKVAALSAQRQAGEHAAPTSDPAPTQQPPLARRNSHFSFPRE